MSAAQEPADVTWDGDGPPEPGSEGGGAPEETPQRPANSVLAQIGEAAVAVIEDADDEKILQVGIHPILRARYRPLADHVRDGLQRQAKARFRRKNMIGQGHQRKGGDQVAGSASDDPEIERYFDALLLAASCVEILVEDTDTGKLTPLQDHLGTVTPVRYTRELAELARLDETFGLDLTTCTPDEIVVALHTWGKERSTSPLTSTAQVLKLWMGKVDVDALEEALGGR